MTQPIKKRTSFNPSKTLEKIPPSLREPVDNEALILARLGAQLLLEELDNKRVVQPPVVILQLVVDGLQLRQVRQLLFLLLLLLLVVATARLLGVRLGSLGLAIQVVDGLGDDLLRVDVVDLVMGGQLRGYRRFADARRTEDTDFEGLFE
jgi:hypothetical protein